MIKFFTENCYVNSQFTTNIDLVKKSELIDVSLLKAI